MTTRDSGSAEDPKLPLMVDAAADSSTETAEAIDRAAAVNDDPKVGQILEQAALSADQTVSRTGWVRSFVHRLLPKRG
jgi:hypothetical protein